MTGRTRTVVQNIPTLEASQVLLDQARLRIAEQGADIGGFRARALGFVTASGIVAGLFAPHVKFSGSALPYIAIGAFGAGVVLLLIALRSVKYDYGPPLPAMAEWLSLHGGHDTSGALIAQATAEGLIAAIEANRRKLEVVPRLLDLAILLLAVQMGLWIAALAIK